MDPHQPPEDGRIPLAYATPPPARPWWPWIVGAFLIIVLVLLLAPTQTTLVLTIEQEGPSDVSVPTSGWTITRPPQEPVPLQPLPESGVTLTLEHQTGRWLPGGSMRLLIGDVTGGQVLVSVRDENGKILADPRPMSPGDVLTLGEPPVWELELTQLRPLLAGDGQADFFLQSAPPATRPTTQPTTRPATQPAGGERTTTIGFIEHAALQGWTRTNKGFWVHFDAPDLPEGKMYRVFMGTPYALDDWATRVFFLDRHLLQA